MKRSPRARAVAALLAMSLLAACSGAKKAEEKSASDVEAGEQTETTLADGDTTTTIAGQPAPGTDGAPVAGDGSTTGGSGGSGSSGGGAPIAIAKPPGFKATTLFSDKENTVGLTKDSITMCAHAALTYAPAFKTGPDELNVFWEALNEEKGGVHGRKVFVSYENDDYKPETAVSAATKCKDKGIFMLLGGIGFDQIPAVRNWAKQNRMLYMHHTATVEGSAGNEFAYTGLPTTEQMGEMFAHLAATKYKGKKIGIIKRASPNWEPGVTAFKKVAKQRGVEIFKEREVTNAQTNYTQELIDMKGADVIWAWENALSAIHIVSQAKSQGMDMPFMLFPFNLTSQTLGDEALDPPLSGIAMFPAYSKGDYSGGFATYADDMKEFERQYAKYRPNAEIDSFGGDLLFLNWTAQKALYVLLDACGKDCTRNKFIDVLRIYNGRPSSSACHLHFGESHVGTDRVNVMETYRASSGKVNWRNTAFCVNSL